MAGVATTHPDYDSMLPEWKKCRDCETGQRAVHAAGELYLPRLYDQDDDQYNAYKLRAGFANFFYRTTTGLKGMMFRVEPQVEAPENVKELFSDITATGISLATFGQMAADELLTPGRLGILVDHPQAPPGISQAEAAKLNLRPTMAIYPAESIINWRTGRVNNATVLTMVVLKEQYSEVSGFEEKNEDRYRVLELVEGVYQQNVYRVDDKKEDVLVEGPIVPQMGGKPLSVIPFVFVSPDTTTPEVFAPPLVDLADLNLSHYRTTATKEAIEFTLVPQVCIFGHTVKEGDKMFIGEDAWVFPNPDTNGAVLEPSGAGAAVLENSLTRKEQQMAIIALRMLEAQKKSVEAAETHQLRNSGEQSVLAAMAATLSEAMTKALTWFAAFQGATGEVGYELETEQLTAIGPQMIAALSALTDKGQMSKAALFDNLKRGQLHPAEATFEDESARIAEDGPTGEI